MATAPHLGLYGDRMLGGDRRRCGLDQEPSSGTFVLDGKIFGLHSSNIGAYYMSIIATPSILRLSFSQ